MIGASMSSPSIVIAGRVISPDHPPYVIAELSGNHNGEIERALAIMEAAKEAGADAIKLQTYTPDTMTIPCDRPEFKVEGGLWDGYTLHDLYKWAHTPWDWFDALFAKGRELGITVFSTPFDESSVDFLEAFDPPAYKIASFENVDLELIAQVASKGKPVLISTGMAAEDEIAEAVKTAHAGGCRELALLHCVSAYPAAAEDSNLRAIPGLVRSFDVVAGLSAHTLGTSVAIAGVAAGAAIIEKHFTLRRDDGGPDAAFSMQPDEMRELVTGCATAFKALGQAVGGRKESEAASLVFRRSLFVVNDMAEGEEFSRENLRVIRPGQGLRPKHLPGVLGKKAARALSRGEPLDWACVAGDDGQGGERNPS